MNEEQNWPSGMPKFTDTERLDFIEQNGLDFMGAHSDSAYIAGKTVVNEDEAGNLLPVFDLRQAIDFVINTTKKG